MEMEAELAKLEKAQGAKGKKRANSIRKQADKLYKKLFEEGVKVSINTDNRTTSDTTLTEEYIHMKSIGFTLQDIKDMNKVALEYAFISDKEKEDLKKRLENKI